MAIKFRDIERLHTDELITGEQKEAIIKRYKLEKNGSGRFMIYCLSTLAALFIIGGAMMLSVSHWNDLSPMLKMGSGMGLLAAAWLAYFGLRQTTPIAAESMSLLGAGVWLSNIILLEKLFMPGTPLVESCFIFLAGIALIPFLTRQRLLVGIVAITSIMLYVWMTSSACGNACDGDPGQSWLMINEWSSNYGMTSYSILLILILFWWLLGERARKSEGIMKGYDWISVPAFITFCILLSVQLMSSTNLELASAPYGRTLYALTPLLFLVLKPKGESWFGWLLLMVATSALFPAIEHFSWHEDKMSGTIICGVYALILAFAGIRCNREAWVNYGSLMVLFTFISLSVNILKSLEGSGLAFVLSGVVMLAAALLLEWQRRFFIRKAVANQPNPSPQA